MESGSGYLLQVSGRGRGNMDSMGLNSPGAASQGHSSVLQQEGRRVGAAAVRRCSKSGKKKNMDPDKPSSLSLSLLLESELQP